MKLFLVITLVFLIHYEIHAKFVLVAVFYLLHLEDIK